MSFDVYDAFDNILARLLQETISHASARSALEDIRSAQRKADAALGQAERKIEGLERSRRDDVKLHALLKELREVVCTIMTPGDRRSGLIERIDAGIKDTDEIPF